MFLNNKYTKCYFDIINRAKTNPPIANWETHHIIPDSFFINNTGRSKPGWLEGNPNDCNNLVNLSIREHRLCHLLLTKMTTGLAKKKMLLAAKLILETRGSKYGLSKGKLYKSIKLQCIEDHKKREVSKETGKKISAALKGRKHSAEHIEKNRTAQLNRSPCSTQTREKLSNSLIGRKFTDEWKEKMKVSRNKRPPISEETRTKMSAAARNREPQSQETKKKISESQKGRQHSPETRAKMKESARNRVKKSVIE